MAVHISHAALPFPVKGARFTLLIPFIDADGDPTDPTTPDTERSIDGAAFADCTEEVSTITGSNGMGYITLTGDEMNASAVGVAAKVASGPKNTLATLYPRVLPSLTTGTAQAGAAGTITLASAAPAYDLSGCIVKTTGGTGGGGGSGSLGNQARIITAYNTTTKVATIEPNWETNPDVTTTYAVLLTELAVNAIMGRFLRATTDERTLDVTATGAAGMDWGNVENPTTTVGLTGTTISSAQTVDVTKLNGVAASAANLEKSASTIVRASAITGTLSTTQMTTDLTEATDDHFNGRIIIWTSGNLQNQATDITDYTGATKLCTFTAITEAPANGDTFCII